MKKNKILFAIGYSIVLTFSTALAGDIDVKFSDTDGGSKFTIQDKNGNDKFSIGSNGSVTVNRKYSLPTENGTNTQAIMWPYETGNQDLKWTQATYRNTIGIGGSSLTKYMYDNDQRLFDLHSNNCSNGWSFITVIGNKDTPPSSEDLGFCIEDAISPATYYDEALLNCLSRSARLPEPVEWILACKQSKGTSYSEWTSNFPILSQDQGSGMGVYVPTQSRVCRSGDCCHASSTGILGYYRNSVIENNKNRFRCVR